MKRILSTISLLTILMISLVSCLKDKGFDDKKYGLSATSNVAVSIPESVSGITVAGIDFVTTTQTFNVFAVQLEAANASSSDIHVNLVANPTLVANYNSAHGTNLIALPAGSYNIPSLKVTIPAGSKTAYLQIVVPNASTLSLTATYGLGFSIASVDESGIAIPANMKNIVVQFGIKNKYDGIYTVVSGKVTRYTSPGIPAGDALSGSVAGNPDLTLSTVGPNTVEVGNLRWAGGTSGVAGIDNLRLTVDPATNQVTIISLGNPTLANWAGSTAGITYNRYDPATKTFYLAFKWNPTSNVREYETVIKYKGPR